MSRNASWLTRPQLQKLAVLCDSSEEVLLVQSPQMALENVVLVHFPRLQFALERDGRFRDLTELERRMVDAERDEQLGMEQFGVEPVVP